MLRISSIATFFVLTILPIIQMVTSLRDAPPIDENRTLAPPPHSFRSAPAEWMREAEAWFDDHFGYRSLLIRAKTQIDYTVFNTSSRVHIGADHQLFYRSVMDVEKPAIDRFLQGRRLEVAGNIRRLHDSLAARGIRMVVSINLLADRYMPEKLPPSSPRYTSPHQIDQLITQIQEFLGVDYLDPTPVLLATSRERPIFHKTDFHWNSPAAGEVSKELVNRWAKLEGLNDPPWSRAVETRPVAFSGGIARFMPLFFTPNETTLDIKVNFAPDPQARAFSNEGIFESGHRMAAALSNFLPTFVMLGDSFCDGYLVAGMPIYFRNFYRIRWSLSTKISMVIESLPSDTHYLLIQLIETNQFGLNALSDNADIDRAIEIINRRQGS